MKDEREDGRQDEREEKMKDEREDERQESLVHMTTPHVAQKSWTLYQDYQDAQVEDAPTLIKIPKSECPDIWIRLPRHKWPKSWPSMEDPVVLPERNLYGHPLPNYNGKGNSRKFFGNTVGKKFQIGNAFWKRRKRTILVCACGRYKTV